MTEDIVPPLDRRNRYRVIALRGPSSIENPLSKPIVTFQYFNSDAKKVDSNNLVCYGDNKRVCLEYVGTVLQGPDITEAALSLRFMAGVAKSFENVPALDTLIGAKEGAIEVQMPEAPGARRGVILVFELVDAEGITQGLIATHDPEIKNDA